MVTQAVTSVTCPNCRTQFTAPIKQIIDAQADPEAKNLLLSGQINLIICPKCGSRGALNTPFLYHDAELELALVYMPMELGMTDMERQKAIGDLTNRVMQQLPPEKRKAYLLQPQTFLSVKGVIDAILEIDTETRELLEKHKRRMEIIEKLNEINLDDALALAEFVGAYDDELDIDFFQTLDLVIDIAGGPGGEVRQDRFVKIRQALMEKSSTGRLLTAQRAAIDALAANPTRETLIEQLIEAEHPLIRETLIAVGRQMLDYAFFQALTKRIDSAEAEDKEALINLRKEILELRDRVDETMEIVAGMRARLLQEILIAEDPRQVVLDHLDEIDDMFFSVLGSNLQQADVEGRQNVVQRLMQVGDMVLAVLNETAPPEVKLIGRLANTQEKEQMRQILQAERELVSEQFLRLVEETAEEMKEAQRPEKAQRLRHAAEQIKEMLAA